MDTENNHYNVRITLAIIVASVGVAFMSRLPQLLPGQQAIPFYSFGFFWAGIVIVVLALLILIVPPRNWKRLWYSILGLPRWLCETYIWKCYGPICTFEDPKVTFELSQDGQTRIYTAKVSLSICLLEKTRNYYPVQVIVSKDTTMFYLEQKRGLIKLPRVSLEIVTGTLREILLNTPGKTTHEWAFSWRANINLSIGYIDIQKVPYEWIIEGIEVHLANINKFRKLSKRGKVSNAKKTN